MSVRPTTGQQWEYPGFGVPGRDGVIHAWYGIGQSLVMLPADMVAAAVERFAKPEWKPQIQSGVVATLTFPALNAATIVLVVLWLGQLGFSLRERLSGGLSLLVGTSFLHYSQVHMENSLQTFLMFADAFLLWKWLKTERTGWLAAAAATVGFAMLVRLPSLAEHFGLWLAVLWLLAAPTSPGAGWLRGLRLGRLLAVALPVVLAGALADRLYHFHRFGRWSGTYIQEYAADWHRWHPDGPADYPFSGNFWEGFLGPFISPDRSVFLLDPLIWLLAGVCLMRWRHIPAHIKAVLASGGIAALLLVIFYAKCDFWDGAGSWGNRYTLTPFHLLLSLAVPLWWRTVRAEVALWARITSAAVVAVAVVIQILSLLLNPAVDASIETRTGKRANAVALRLQNAVALFAGEPAPPGVYPAMWRINLAPARLGNGSPVRLAISWLLWLLGVVFAWRLGRKLWETASMNPAIAPPKPALAVGDEPDSSPASGLNPDVHERK